MSWASMRTSGCSIVQLVQRRDDAVAQRHVGLQQAFDAAPAGASGVPMRTSTGGSSRWIDGRVRIVQQPVEIGHDRVAVTRKRGRRHAAVNSGRASAANSGAMSSRRTARCVARIAWRATTGSASAIKRVSRSANRPSGTSAEHARRLAPIAQRRSRPALAPCPRESAARHRDSATGPGRRGMRPAPRGSRSPRSRRAPRADASGSTPHLSRARTAAPRSGRRGRDRAAARSRRAAIVLSPAALSSASARLPDVWIRMRSAARGRRARTPLEPAATPAAREGIA